MLVEDVLVASPVVPAWNGVENVAAPEPDAPDPAAAATAFEEETVACPGDGNEETVEGEENPKLELVDGGEVWCGCRKWGCPS